MHALEKNPGIKAKELITKVRDKTGLSRSTIYSHLESFDLQGKIHRERGRYWLPGQKRAEALELDKTFRDFIVKESSEITGIHARAYDLRDQREAYERAMLLASHLGISTERFREKENYILSKRYSIDLYWNRREQRKRLWPLMRTAVDSLVKEITRVAFIPRKDADKNEG